VLSVFTLSFNHLQLSIWVAVVVVREPIFLLGGQIRTPIPTCLCLSLASVIQKSQQSSAAAVAAVGGGTGHTPPCDISTRVRVRFQLLLLCRR
jgi:hypothetical protein